MSKLLTAAWTLVEKPAIWFYTLVLKLAGRTPDEEGKKSFLQFVKFCVVGVSNTLVNYLLYLLFLYIFAKSGMVEKRYMPAQVMAFFLSVLWSYYWNNRYVFAAGEGEKRVWWKTLIKTYISYAFTGLFLNMILLYVWIDVLHLSEVVAPIINIVINVPLNFIINKVFAYGQGKKRSTDRDDDKKPSKEGEELG